MYKNWEKIPRIEQNFYMFKNHLSNKGWKYEEIEYDGYVNKIQFNNDKCNIYFKGHHCKYMKFVNDLQVTESKKKWTLNSKIEIMSSFSKWLSEISHVYDQNENRILALICKILK